MLKCLTVSMNISPDKKATLSPYCDQFSSVPKNAPNSASKWMLQAAEGK